VTQAPGSVTLVVVDDVPEVRGLLRTVLSRDSRFDVVAEGEDGLQAVRLAQQLAPTVILLDISMPRLDGIAAIPRIRSASPRTCVVMCTAHDEPKLADQALSAGANGVVSKATPPDELADTILGILAKHLESALPNETEQLRRSEERFRLLVEAVEDYAIFMLDPAGVVVSWNSGAQRIKGYSASEIIGRHFRVFYPEEKQRAAHPEYELIQALAEGHFEEEGWRVRKDGSLMWANVLITPVHDNTGRHVGFAKVTRDISERRLHQQERERSSQLLADVNAELAAANRVLTESAAQRADFLAVTAHELRTPISVITGSADVLTKMWPELDDGERNELLGTISTSAGRLNRLLRDLLTAAKLEAGRMELTQVPTQLGELLDEAVSAARARYGLEAPAVVVVDDLVALADRDRVAQAVDNLVQNAYRHGLPPVRLLLRRRADHAEILVQDAGDGVPDHRRDRVFERYVTGGAERRTTGLGLFIVRELARAHGGDAWWQGGSASERGFVFSLPLADGGAPRVE
jgi:PAS domain S-box-containing protein